MRASMKSLVYDSSNDILYCTFGNKENSYGDEEPDNIVIMRDMEKEDITGITVLDFRKMYYKKDTRLRMLEEYISIEKTIELIKL